LVIVTELPVLTPTDQPLIDELPLLVTVILATKPLPQLFRLTEQLTPPEPPLELLLDDELELLLEEFELLDDEELELLEELVDELELLLEELELLDDEELEPPPKTTSIQPWKRSNVHRFLPHSA
jgi:hypothetical protein